MENKKTAQIPMLPSKTHFVGTLSKKPTLFLTENKNLWLCILFVCQSTYHVTTSVETFLDLIFWVRTSVFKLSNISQCDKVVDCTKPTLLTPSKNQAIK